MVTNKTTCKNILRTQSKASERHHPVEPSQTSSHLHFSKNMFSNKILKYIHLVSDNKRMEWKVSHSESSEISDRILTAPFRHNAVQKKCVWWLITYWSLLLSVVKVCRFTVSWVMCEQLLSAVYKQIYRQWSLSLQKNLKTWWFSVLQTVLSMISKGLFIIYERGGGGAKRWRHVQ